MSRHRRICRSARAIEAHRGVASLADTLGRSVWAERSLRHLSGDATLAAPTPAVIACRQRR
ncbi:hypothetical protein [Verminephrobacter eiseniae]|uniref:hypothetical protein n=1 Tax=Verminephrobacter eiseniae TaxID=364317 RepID=UPI0012EEA0BF|nr:hypothetical protein [Verminephrobacter eiseniae]